MGGALATLTALELALHLEEATRHLSSSKKAKARSRDKISLYTYGAPRIGNTAFAELLLRTLGPERIYRVTHLNDAVARVPPRLLGFAHAGREFHITSPRAESALSADFAELSQEENMVVGRRDVRMLEARGTRESGRGCAGYERVNVDVHHVYFGVIDGCEPGGSEVGG